MNKKTVRIIYFISSGFLTALMLMSAGMYFFNHSMVVESFQSLGYPTYLIYPLAIAKLLGLAAIWIKKCKLKEWAYAGFFFDLVLASAAHIAVKDGEFMPALVGIVLVIISYLFEKKVNRKK